MLQHILVERARDVQPCRRAGGNGFRRKSDIEGERDGIVILNRT
jgi:hypothetical protein